MNAKFTLVFLVVLGLFLAALASRSPALAWMALPFLFYLGAGLLSAPVVVRLRAARALSHPRCEAGTTITMTLTLENSGPTIPRLHIADPIWPKMELIDGTVEQAARLPAGESMSLRCQFRAPRGEYRWESVRVIASDLFGLFESTLNLPAPAQVLVIPAQPPAARLRLHPAHTLRAAGPNLSRRAGAGVDFFGVREYHLGDSLRWVHWRLSARHPRQFFTKEFEREEMADIGFILDGRASGGAPDGPEELQEGFFENSVQATAAIAKSLLQMGNRVSLLVLGERVARVFPGTGKRQLARILNQLAIAQPGEKVSLDTLKYLPVRLFPSHALIVVISPLRGLEFAPIARLRAAGHPVLLVSPNPLQADSRGADAALAVRAARLERAALLWRMREMGVQVIDWPVDQPLLPLIRVHRWARL